MPDAAFPFDDQTADIIVRSADMVDFRIHKLILQQASPVFRDMFTFPTPVAEVVPTERDIPVVQVTEKSALLLKLLSFSHPSQPPPFLKDVDQLWTFFCVVEKYNMDQAMTWVKQELMRFKDTWPFRVYIIACHSGWATEAQRAAVCTLSWPLDELILSGGREAKAVGVDTIQPLITYQRKCLLGARCIVALQYWPTSLQLECFEEDPETPLIVTLFYLGESHCDCVGKYPPDIEEGEDPSSWEVPVDEVYLRSWLYTYLHNIRTTLKSLPLDPKIASQPEFIVGALMEANKCEKCAPNALEQLTAFSKCVTKHIEERIKRFKLGV